MKKEKKELSLIKTAMMLCVVLYHSCLFYSENWFTYVSPAYKANYINIFSFWLSTFHIQTFTFVSGYLFFYLKSIGNYKEKKKDIIKRAKKLLLPLIFAEIFWIVPFYIYYYGFEIKTIIKKFILLESPSQLWFLPMLFIIFLFYDLLYDKIKISFKVLTLTFVLSIIISTILSKMNINFFNISNAIKYSLFFYLGGYIFYKDKKITRKKMYYMILITFLLLIYEILAQIYNISITKYLNIIVMPLLSSLEAIIIYKIAIYIINKNKINTENKIYTLLKNNSFGIYLFHQQIIFLTITKLNGLVHPIIQCVLSFIISIIVSIIISNILRKNRITKEMFGL